MEEELTCPLCLDFLTAPIRMTTCGHCFCQNCLGNIASETPWLCPECRMEQVQRPEDLARNYLFERILQNLFKHEFEQQLNKEKEMNQTIFIRKLRVCRDDLESQVQKEKVARRKVEADKISLENNLKELREDKARADSKLEKNQLEKTELEEVLKEVLEKLYGKYQDSNPNPAPKSNSTNFSYPDEDRSSLFGTGDEFIFISRKSDDTNSVEPEKLLRIFMNMIAIDESYDNEIIGYFDETDNSQELCSKLHESSCINQGRGFCECFMGMFLLI